MADVLVKSANAVVAATIVKRVTGDVVRSLPYPAIGAAALLGLLGGAMISRQRRRSRA